MYWTKPLQGVWVWVLIGEWEAKWREQAFVMIETCMGCCDSESYARPPSQSAEVLGRLHMTVTGIRQHHFFDSKRSSF
jgi:hypothetical protein